ncbi:multi-sensor signal transduction histidine kinase [Arcobacter nitrofigilis DSM 7299]|uniref:histidine kinase n=1 Tax=Arcobacter nitrofigilis (strain ATCC 33309 / DSM 7299 / CCUG 15893 / LMG 7604 / NCTC 12251 / CI) TaxID=572480 RepID=D5V1C9_ARCNC|nr:PAS domain-containing sensor histidine kinase [Arcobacter nitrofigilis]ADG94091.1 multi-sensor signal transduction histidine kinase [Arcobacter nitrofigilis DSM 7299]
MKKNFFTFLIFIFLEVIIYTSLIYNENLHINKVLENSLHNSYGEFKVLREYFFEESSEKIYSKFNHIVLLNSTLDIKTYQEYEKEIKKLSIIFTDVKELNFLKNKKVFEAIKNKEEKVLLFEKDKTSISISLIPYFESKNVLNYFIRFNNQSQIYDMKFRTKILFLVFSILITILVGYTYFIYNIKTKLSIKNEENEELLEVIDKYILMTETDIEGFITKVSTAFCEVTGFSKQELIGRPHSIIRHPDVSKDVFKHMWHVLKSGDTWKGEIKNIDKNGNIYWVEGTIVPKYDKDKNIIGYLSLRKDITDKKRLDELNDKLKYQIEEKINEMEILDSNLIQQSKKALVGDLVDIIAHQWKQPLSIISLYAIDLSESVKYGEMNQEYANELSDKFQRQIAHLSSTLNSFRAFFGPSAIYDKFTLYENVENVLLLLEDELKINKIDIKIQGDKDIKIFGISNEFQHIFLNFISNSRDAFIEKEIKNRQIIISFFEKKGEIQIDYIDNAGGIKENIIHKIFDLNFTTKPIGLGTGVGMYATKLIIDKLSGKISVNNYKDGVNFKILLPNKDRRKND